ncbi:uncharacterized protein [Asterias amurensis]|uniref:uncharacterized protein n=1 Tax=Asterias amurensis TaxID=7602 RepID=UPI003AB83CD4
MPGIRQRFEGTTTRMRNIKGLSFLLFGASIVFLLYAELETSSHFKKQSKTIKQRNVMHTSFTSITNSRTLFDTRSPSPNSSNTMETSLQSDTIENSSPNGNNSLSFVASKYPPIDLEKEVPPLDSIFKRTVIVTAVSSDHFMEVQRMIGMVQTVMPTTRIVAYSLGLSTEQVETMSILCNVELRHFNFSKYPGHVKDLLNYAWKPPIIKETLYEFGAVFWADSSVIFTSSIQLLTKHLKTFHGFIPRVANYAKAGPFSVCTLTHPAMFNYLKIDIKTYQSDDGYIPKPQGGILYFVNSSYINEQLLQPWVDCAMSLNCIAPEGSQNPHEERKEGYHKHRYDQSALALLMYKNLRGLYHRGHDATETFNSVMRVVNRGTPIQKVGVKRCQGKKL